MPTGSDFALVTDKKLLGVRDFDLWLLKYLRTYIGKGIERLFIQGSFKERMPLSSPDDSTIEVGLKPTELDGVAHDGAGHFLDLEQIDRTATFANVTGQLYEVGASYIEYPVGIRTNPRTGKFEYDRMREGIGVAANPDSVVSVTPTLTFVVDSLFEQGVSAADNSGRQVRVFLVIPGDAATSEAVAIETCEVFYDGQNKITTAGLLGQSAPLTSSVLYLVQLIGVTVLMDSATNKPSLSPESVFFIGTVLGNGGTPTVFDITDQKIIQAQSADGVTVEPLPNWFDGTTNTESTVQDALADIVSDLTSVTDEYGAGKISAKELPSWFDGDTIPANQIGFQLSRIVSDLAEIGGDGSIAGAQKVSALDLGAWADATPTGPGSIQDQFYNILGALTSVDGLRGAGKLTSPDLPNWADSTANPADTVAAQLAKIITDLASAGGASKITVDAIAGYPIGITDENLQNFLSAILFYTNMSLLGLKQTAEAAGMRALAPVAINPSWTLVALAYSTNSLGTTATMVAVGDEGSIMSRGQGAQWAQRTPADGYSSGWKGIAQGTLGYAVCGDGGWIQTSSDTIVWTTRKFLGNNFIDMAYKSTSTATYCAVGLGGYIWTSTNLTTWTQRSLPGGATDNIVAVCAGVAKGSSSFATQIFVATCDNGKIYSSPDGITWTLRATLSGTTPKFLDRMLQNNARFGFVALFTRNSDSQIGVAHSDDGITWSFSTSSSATDFDEPNTRMCLLDESIAYLGTTDDSSPYSLNAIQVGGETVRPSYASSGQNVFDITECFPFGAENVNGVLYVVGRFNDGDGGIWAGAPARPALGQLNQF